MKNKASRLARWVLRLRPYKMDVVYRRGTLNSIVDHLSIYPLDGGAAPLNLMLRAAVLPMPKIDVGAAQRGDSFCTGLSRILGRLK